MDWIIPTQQRFFKNEFKSHETFVFSASIYACCYICRLVVWLRVARQKEKCE